MKKYFNNYALPTSITISIVWLILLIVGDNYATYVKIPNEVLSGYNVIVPLLFGSIVLSIFYYLFHKTLLLKMGSIVTSGLVQGILASKYLVTFPPLDPITLQCTFFTIWYMLVFLANTGKEMGNGVNR